MDATEFITLAGKLVAVGAAGARSAVSRAYYGSFHLALSVLSEKASESCGSGRAHNLVPLYLRSVDHPDAIAAADLLADLHADRIKSDYRLDLLAVEDPRFAMNGVESAREIERRLARFRVACDGDPMLPNRLREGISRIKAAFGT